jgi:hypothetical protein
LVNNTMIDEPEKVTKLLIPFLKKQCDAALF